MFGKGLTTNLDSTKLEELADDNIKFDEIEENSPILVENTVVKGEIARYEQFLLFPQCFSKDLYCRLVKTRACLGKGLNAFTNQSEILTFLRIQTFEN